MIEAKRVLVRARKTEILLFLNAQRKHPAQTISEIEAYLNRITDFNGRLRGIETMDLDELQTLGMVSCFHGYYKITDVGRTYLQALLEEDLKAAA